MSLIYVLLVAHFVADFLCQTDWMALNKSKRWDALAWHVAAYGGGTVVVLALATLAGVVSDPGLRIWPWLLVNLVAHFVQDAITSRINARFWFFRMAPGIWAQAPNTMPIHGRTLVNPWVPEGGNRHWFFVGIGADQLLHYVTLFATAEWLLP